MSISIQAPGPLPFKLGYRLPTVGRYAAVPRFADKNPRIDPSQWREVDLTNWRTQRYQQQHNDCTGNGQAVVMGALWNMSTGVAKKFSAAWIYAHANGDRDEGAMVRDVVAVAQTTGCATQDVAGEHKIWRRDYTQAVAGEASKCLLGEVYQCEDFVDIGSAHQAGMLVVYGILIDQAFMQGTGKDGICPARIDLRQIVGGHCMASFGVRKVNGSWRSVTVQSWPQWGTPDQLGYVAEDYFTPVVRHPQYGEMLNLDAYAIRTIVDRTGEGQPPVLR